MNRFLERFTDELRCSLTNAYEDNFDHVRFGGATITGGLLRWKQKVKRALQGKGFLSRSVVASILNNSLLKVAPLAERLDALYSRLEDDESRDLLIKILAFRCLGHQFVRLPLSTPEYWDRLAQAESLADKNDSLDPRFLDWRLFKFDLASIGVPLAMYSTPKSILTQFLLEQYRCNRNEEPAITVQPNDCVIDCGGCWGDTALYFSHRVGAGGTVFSFEFIPTNLKIFESNLSLNPQLSQQIELVSRAAWFESDLSLQYEECGPGSTVTIGHPVARGSCTSTLSIDDLVAQRDLSKVDFIKMDIEGAELNALKGASRTIRNCRPKLAIAVYHHLEDFVDIPELIDLITPGYRFYLRHFTIHSEETVLFASQS